MGTRTSRIATLAALCALAAAPAAAQVRTSVWNRVDVAPRVVGLSGVDASGDDLNTSSFGPAFTFNINERHAIVVGLEYARWENSSSRHSALAQTVEYRRTFDTPLKRTRFYLSGGVMGIIDRSTSKTYAYSSTAWVPPIIPMGSFGVEVFVTPRLGFRGEVGMAGLPPLAAVRAGIGIIISTGRLRSL